MARPTKAQTIERQRRELLLQNAAPGSHAHLHSSAIATKPFMIKEMPIDLHTKIKITSAETGIPMATMIIKILRNVMSMDNVDNVDNVDNTNNDKSSSREEENNENPDSESENTEDQQQSNQDFDSDVSNPVVPSESTNPTNPVSSTNPTSSTTVEKRVAKRAKALSNTSGAANA